ncbi:ETC complex I subunit [Rhizobium mongolense]|uniref:ETC complex I subunit n=1 Tax=Rhizobium mongolense TaxID=57676 RepID=UPI0034A2D0A1
METVRPTHNERIAMASGSRVSNDNRRSHPCFGHSLFSEKAVARIFKPSRSVTTSGTARTKGWRLVFDRRSAPFIEPLMGYTGSADTLTQVELKFPTLESAIRYAEGQGLSYVVQRPPGKTAAQAKQGTGQRSHQPSDALADATLERLDPPALQQSDRRALDGKTNQDHASGPAMWSFPIGVLRDRALSLEAKRSILMNWAWTEYLASHAIYECTPENNRPSHLHEIEEALLALDRETASRRDDSMVGRKAA